MPLTLSNQDALLQDFYDGAVREQLNNDVPMYRLLEQSDKKWSGRRVIYPIHSTRNSGVGARAEQGTLPTGGNQGHNQVIVTASYFYARGRLTGQTIAAGKHAFAEALSNEMDGLVNDATVDLGRQTWGTGDGRIAQVGVSATVDATAISFFNRFAEPGQPGARYMQQNGFIELGTVADSDARGGPVSVNSISISSNPATTTDTIAVSNSFAILSSTTDYAFVEGAGGSGVEALGIQALVDVFTESNYFGSNAFFGSALLGINRASVQAWNATILGNSQTERIIDGNLMQTAFDRIHVDSGMEADLIFGHHDVVRAFLDSVASDRRYSSPDFNAGRSGLSYNGVAIERDRQAPYNSLLVCKKDALKIFTLKPMGFADRDGAILDRVANADSWDFWLSMYWNLAVDGNMKSCVMIRDIKTDL